MNRSLRDEARFATRRRGVTLVEMLITLAVLLLMMTVIVQIFQAATGALSSAQAYQELDGRLRQVDSLIRSDLRGITAHMTPPLDPKDNLGYFEYIENAFADQQGEDTDDCLKFTAKAPDGKPFVGRCWPIFQDNTTTPPTYSPHPNGPITITSQFAEIVYFLRNGNLYRRVFLVAPERQSSIIQMIGNTAYYNAGANSFTYPYPPGSSNPLPVSWLGMNDISARPAPAGSMAKIQPSSIILNTLGDLTNRENRAFSPRWGNDYQSVVSGAPVLGPDNRPDDFNLDSSGNPVGDGVTDYYPTLYPNVFAPTNNGPLIYELASKNGAFVFNVAARVAPGTPADFYRTMPFPFVFPGAYSMPEPGDSTMAQGAYGNGWIHSPNPDTTNAFVNNANALTYLQRLNHGPLDQGDNLPRPYQAAQQTWWGFPTWRETLSFNWTDPTVQVNDLVNNTNGQPNGLWPRWATDLPSSNRVPNDANLLPPMTYSASVNVKGTLYPYSVRLAEQPFNDAWGEGTDSTIVSQFWTPGLWSTTWEDDLLATGVRSFDVKAYDISLGQYADLGWGDDLRLTRALLPSNQTVLPNGGLAGTGTTPPLPYAYGNYDDYSGSFSGSPSAPAYLFTNGDFFDLLGQTFAHEGRMPPLVNDFRFDSQFGASTYLYPNGNTYTGNIGDDGTTVIRLRRVWDSWSTDYSRARANGVDPTAGFPVGPPFTPPIYPSYPPPYPAPLRGIQIQIRVTDPTNQRVKTLTIRQDFTDKL